MWWAWNSDEVEGQSHWPFWAVVTPRTPNAVGLLPLYQNFSGGVMVQEPSLREEMALYAEGYRYIAGLDEAGRGSWAGPVMAGAVVLPIVRPDLSQRLQGVRDSKQLTPRQRERLYGIIESAALAVGVGIVPPHKIDELGIVPATRQAMGLAIAQLNPPPDFLLIDFLNLPELSIPQKSITRGDALSLSIAAASIVAKVTRDRLMVKMDARYPGYGFARHKGYGTRQHRESLFCLGPSPIHRLSFAPMRLMLNRSKIASRGGPVLTVQDSALYLAVPLVLGPRDQGQDKCAPMPPVRWRGSPLCFRIWIH